MEADTEINTKGHNKTADHMIGGLTALCMLVGLIGNTSAFLYFWGRKRRSVHNMLYLTITSVDICTSLSAATIVVVLFNNRDPFLLEDSLFCTQWYVIIGFSLRMSMFLVVLISITRTINIVFPFFSVSYHKLIYAVLMYGAWLLIFDGVVFGLKIMYPRYNVHHACCLPFPPESNHDPGITLIVWWFAIEAEFMLPSVVVFISFTASTVSLYKRNSVKSEKDEKFRRATVTIALFTVVFLVCNIPCFLYQLNVIIYRLSAHTVGLDVNKPGSFYWYGSLVSQLFTTFLNAALNPCLYFLRMRPMRLWIRERVCRCCNIARKASKRIVPQSSTTDEK